jgi:HSP20 family protein
VVESENHFKIELAAPGLEKKDFDLSVEKDQLIIESSKKEEKEVNNEKFTRREFNYASFKRSFYLPEFVDVDKIAATYENGVLNISLPKVAQAKAEASRTIKIS